MVIWGEGDGPIHPYITPESKPKRFFPEASTTPRRVRLAEIGRVLQFPLFVKPTPQLPLISPRKR